MESITKTSDQLFAALVNTKTPKSLTISTASIYLISVMTMSFLLLLVGMVIVIFKVIYLPVAIPLSVGLGAVIWSVIPRLPKAPIDLLDKSRFPELSEVIDQVSSNSDLRNMPIFISAEFDVKVVVYYRHFNTFYFLNLGYPIIFELSDDQLIAVIRDEFANLKIKNLEQTYLVQSAINNLDRWLDILKPVERIKTAAPLESRSIRESRIVSSNWVSVFSPDFLANGIRTVFAAVPYGLLFILIKNLVGYRKHFESRVSMTRKNDIEQLRLAQALQVKTQEL